MSVCELSAEEVGLRFLAALVPVFRKWEQEAREEAERVLTRVEDLGGSRMSSERAQEITARLSTEYGVAEGKSIGFSQAAEAVELAIAKIKEREAETT